MKQDRIERGQDPASIGEGLRRLTPGLIRAEKLAHDRVGTPLPARYQIKNAVSVLRGANRLTFSEAETLIALIDFCGTWETEGIATVFATNGRIRSRLCGVNDDRAMRARLAALGRRSLICHIERPGGRRGVEVDPESGERTYFGISLLPLVALLPEIEQIEAFREAEYAKRMKLKRKAKSMMSRIETLASAAMEFGLDSQEWLARVNLAEEIIQMVDECDDIADLIRYADSLQDFCDTSMTALDEAMHVEDIERTILSTDVAEEVSVIDAQDSGYPALTIPPETINKSLTDKSEQCTLGCKWGQRANLKAGPLHSNVNYSNDLDDVTRTTDISPDRYGSKPDHNAGQKKMDRPSLLELQPIGSDQTSIEVVSREIKKFRISPDHLVEISEGLAAYIPYENAYDPTWTDVAASAYSLRPVIGLSENGWNFAVKALGVSGATVAMAIATADVNRSKIRKSAAEYIVWMASFTKNGGHVGLGSKLRSALSRSRR